jgi:hypothetical protein
MHVGSAVLHIPYFRVSLSTNMHHRDDITFESPRHGKSSIRLLQQTGAGWIPSLSGILKRMSDNSCIEALLAKARVLRHELAAVVVGRFIVYEQAQLKKLTASGA